MFQKKKNCRNKKLKRQQRKVTIRKTKAIKIERKQEREKKKCERTNAMTRCEQPYHFSTISEKKTVFHSLFVEKQK